MRRQRFLVSVAEHSLLIAAALAFLAPVVFITLTALMTSNQALSPELWPKTFEWSNFAEVFHKSPLLKWTLNTMIYAGLATLGVVVSSIPVAYALSRLRWRGRDAVFMVVLVALMLPPQVAVVPLYVMWAKLGLVGTLWPLIIPVWLGDAFAIFLLRQFFLTIPEEYLDAARVDGCGEFRILTTVVVRLAKPAIAAVALFSVLYCFNDFFLPLLYVGENPDNWVVQIGLSQFRSLHQVQWNLVMAATHPRDAAGDRPLLPRAESLRRGRHADGGEGMKIAVIGGGSTYTPELVSGLSRERDRIGVRQLVLHDIDPERREVVGGLAGADARAPGLRGRADRHRRARPRARRRRLRPPPDPRRRPGGAALRRDGSARLRLHRPGDHRRRRPRKALRTVPVVLEIAERVRELSSPDAWIVDFTNPVGIVTRSLLDAGHRAVGLCNVAIGFQRSFAQHLGRRAGAR